MWIHAFEIEIEREKCRAKTAESLRKVSPVTDITSTDLDDVKLKGTNRSPQ